LRRDCGQRSITGHLDLRQPDPKRATEAIGQVEFGEIEGADGTGNEAPQE
jgi:hypothetical protein